MSGPIRPPLRVRDTDSSPNVIPVNTIVVSDGDLVDDGGATVTIDTSGSGGTPGAPAQSIQFNSDPAGTFSGSERLLFETGSNNAQIFIKSGASATQTEIRAVDGWGMQIGATNADNSIRNQIALFGENDGPDGILLIPDTGQNVKISGNTGTSAGLTTGGATTELVLSTYDNYTQGPTITLTPGVDGGVTIQNDGAGVTEIQNKDTDTDTVLSILGNGTGVAKLDLQNASKRVWVLCDSNKELKVQGGAAGNTFVLDVSSATGGITWPDGTTQITAASGGTPAGSDTEIQFNNGGAFGASSDLTWDGDSIILGADKTIQLPSAYQTNPTPLNFTGDLRTGISHNGGGAFSIFSQGTIVQTHSLEGIKINRAAARIYMDGSDKLNLQGSATGAIRCNDAYDLPSVVTGANDYVLTAQTDGSTAWAAAGGDSDPLNPILGALSLTGTNTRYETAAFGPYGVGPNASQNYGPLWDDFCELYPFVAVKSGQLSEFGTAFGSASSGGMTFAVYDSNATTQMPDTLLAHGSIAYSSNASVYQTSLTAPTGTGVVGSLIAGNQYWCSYKRHTAGTDTTMKSMQNNYRSRITPIEDCGDNDGALLQTTDYTASTTFPDTFDTTNLVPENNNIPRFTYKVT